MGVVAFRKHRKGRGGTAGKGIAVSFDGRVFLLFYGCFFFYGRFFGDFFVSTIVVLLARAPSCVLSDALERRVGTTLWTQAVARCAVTLPFVLETSQRLPARLSVCCTRTTDSRIDWCIVATSLWVTVSSYRCLVLLHLLSCATHRQPRGVYYDSVAAKPFCLFASAVRRLSVLTGGRVFAV